MSVFFHGSFGLNGARMSGLLKQAMEKPSSTDAQLAKPFGYGAPFSSRYRSWLHKCGVTDMGLPMKLTPLGEIVFKKDPGKTGVSATQCKIFPILALAPPVGLETTTNGLIRRGGSLYQLSECMLSNPVSADARF